MSRPVIVSWSGGKDSALALREVLRAGEFEVVALLTTVARGEERVQIQNVRRALVERQAEALGLPLRCVQMRKGATNREYEESLSAALAEYAARGVKEVVFGDLFLEDVRAYRESFLSASGVSGIFPLWGRDTGALMDDLIASGSKAVVTSVDARALDATFAGSEVDGEFLARLPAGVDPCGENGEFHTFAYDGPTFARPVSFTKGGVTAEEGFYFCDLVPD